MCDQRTAMLSFTNVIACPPDINPQDFQLITGRSVATPNSIIDELRAGCRVSPVIKRKSK